VTTILFTIGLMGLAMALMAVGVMMGRPELKGSCGGIGSAGCHCKNEPGDSCSLETDAAAIEALIAETSDPGASPDDWADRS